MTGSFNTIHYKKMNTVTWTPLKKDQNKDKNTDIWRTDFDIRYTNKDGKLSEKEICDHNDKVRKLFAEKICDYRDGKQFIQPCDWFDKKHYQRLYTDRDILQK